MVNLFPGLFRLCYPVSLAVSSTSNPNAQRDEEKDNKRISPIETARWQYLRLSMTVRALSQSRSESHSRTSLTSDPPSKNGSSLRNCTGIFVDDCAATRTVLSRPAFGNRLILYSHTFHYLVTQKEGFWNYR